MKPEETKDFCSNFLATLRRLDGFSADDLSVVVKKIKIKRKKNRVKLCSFFNKKAPCLYSSG